MIRRLLPAVLVLAAVAVVLWASDRITLQGERTIFTVNCEQGTWQGRRCTGRMVVGAQYAFRASRSRHEVIYWMRGSDSPSGKYSDCTVKDRDNWSCAAQVDQKPALTFEMTRGKPTHAGAGLTVPFHSVPKWKWWAIDMGVHAFSEADE